MWFFGKPTGGRREQAAVRDWEQECLRTWVCPTCGSTVRKPFACCQTCGHLVMKKPYRFLDSDER